MVSVAASVWVAASASRSAAWSAGSSPIGSTTLSTMSDWISTIPAIGPSRLTRNSRSASFDSNAPILQRVIRQRAERAAIPFHDHRQELRDHDGRFPRKLIERRTQSEAHP